MTARSASAGTRGARGSRGSVASPVLQTIRRTRMRARSAQSPARSIGGEKRCSCLELILINGRRTRSCTTVLELPVRSSDLARDPVDYDECEHGDEGYADGRNSDRHRRIPDRSGGYGQCSDSQSERSNPRCDHR